MCSDQRVFSFSQELSLEAQRAPSSGHLLASRELGWSHTILLPAFNQTSPVVELPALSTVLQMVHGRLKVLLLGNLLV